MIKKNVTIRAKVLIPMGIVMASLISALVLTEYKVEFSSLEEQYRNYFSSTEKLFDSEVD
jgi:sensor domain CHASE-containing protein